MALPHLRGFEPFGGIDIVKFQAAVVTHPVRINRVIFPGRLPVNFILPRADDRIATGPAARTDAFGFFEKPDSHFESKIAARQSPDRTNIYGVQRIIAVEQPARMCG